MTSGDSDPFFRILPDVGKVNVNSMKTTEATDTTDQQQLLNAMGL